MKLLITGASGFIGSYVVAEAYQRGHDVVPMIRGEKPAAWKGLHSMSLLQWDLAGSDIPPLNRLEIDCIIHLAASMAGSFEERFQVILGGTDRLIAAARAASISKVVSLSSISVLDYSALNIRFHFQNRLKSLGTSAPYQHFFRFF